MRCFKRALSKRTSRLPAQFHKVLLTVVAVAQQPYVGMEFWHWCAVAAEASRWQHLLYDSWNAGEGPIFLRSCVVSLSNTHRYIPRALKLSKAATPLGIASICSNSSLLQLMKHHLDISKHSGGH
eukprot:6473742-Amphidinium_carterae.1